MMTVEEYQKLIKYLDSNDYNIISIESRYRNKCGFRCYYIHFTIKDKSGDTKLIGFRNEECTVENIKNFINELMGNREWWLW